MVERGERDLDAVRSDGKKLAGLGNALELAEHGQRTARAQHNPVSGGLLRTRSAEHRAGSADRRSRTTGSQRGKPYAGGGTPLHHRVLRTSEAQTSSGGAVRPPPRAVATRLITRAQHRRICLLQAAAWQTLGEWLSGEREDGQLASKYVLACFSDATQLWDQAELQLDIRSKVRWTSGRLMVGVTRIRRGRVTG